MGRPINKRNFGTGTGNQLKTVFKLAGTEYTGYVLRQRGTLKFSVTDGTRTGICQLVDKAPGTLSDNEMIIEVMTDSGTKARASKLYSRVAIVNGNKVPWNYAATLVDGAVQIADESGNLQILTIAINDQPDNISVGGEETATFTVIASGVGDLVYQWQKAESTSNTVFVNIDGANSASYTTDVVSLDDDGDVYRVIVSSTSNAATPVTSTAVTLTVA